MERLFHVTKKENLDSIFREGLLLEKFQDGVVWLFKHREDIKKYLRDAPKNWTGNNIIIECIVPSYQLRRGDWPVWREYYITKNISPNRIIGAVAIE